MKISRFLVAFGKLHNPNNISNVCLDIIFILFLSNPTLYII